MGASHVKMTTPSMNPRVQHAYRYRGRHKAPEQTTSEVQSPRVDSETNEPVIRGGPVAVSGKSVSGRVADHGNYQYSSTMGSTTQRDRTHVRPRGRDGLQDYLNSARTATMAPGTGGFGGPRPAEPLSPRSRALDIQNLRKPTKAQTLKHHIKQGEVNRVEYVLEDAY